jgi:hypothetical protein
MFIPSFFKLKHSFTVVFLSNFFFCIESIFPHQTFDNDTIFFSVRGSWSSCIPLDHHSVPFGHFYICCTTQTLPFGWKYSGCKHSLTCDESLSDLVAESWSQTLNNFQSHRPFCSLVKLGLMDGDNTNATSPLLFVLFRKHPSHTRYMQNPEDFPLCTYDC